MASKEYQTTLQMNKIDPDALKALVAQPSGSGAEVALGTVVGKIRGISYRSNPQNPAVPAIALTGYFECVPYNAERSTIIAQSVFLPGALQGPLVEQVKGDSPAPTGVMERGKKIDIEAGGEYPLAVEIGARRGKTDGGAGYEFISKLLVEATAREDVLGDLRQYLPARDGDAPMQLAAPATKEEKPAAKPARSKKR